MAGNGLPQVETRALRANAPLLQVITIPLLMAGVMLLIASFTWMFGVAGSIIGGSTHRPAAIYAFAAVCVFLSLWLVLSAVFAYLNIGQAKKIDIITGFYNADTIAEYFDQFWSGRNGIRDLVDRYRGASDKPKAELAKQLESRLKDLFATDFGLRVFIVPLILLVTIGSIVLFLGYIGGIGLAVAIASGQPPPGQPFGLKLDLVSIGAIFGAYTWVSCDVIVRNHQWTLHPSDLTWYALRLIIAIPLGQALAMTVYGAAVTASTTGLPTSAGAAILPAGAGAFVAFVANMFSLDAIINALGTVATRFGLQLASSTEERDDLIVQLAGVDELTARALKVEGVSTIAQLVTVDPIRTSIHTGLPFEYILNLIDAALLWTFVGSKLPLMRPLGLRGASDVLALDEDWQTAGVASGRTAMLAALATSSTEGGPGLTAVGFDVILQRLRMDSYAKFVKRLLT